MSGSFRGGFLLRASLPIVVSLAGAAAIRFGFHQADRSPSRAAELATMGLVAAGLVTSVILVNRSASTAARDLNAILRYTERVGQGDVAVPPPRVDRSDEVGALATTTVAAFEGLRSSSAELTNARRTLLERNASQATEIARLNQELKKRAAELAAASRSKEEFLANVTHELRTPLNSIIGLTQLLRDGTADSPEEAQSFLDQVLVSARHLLQLINDVLELAKIDSGKMVLDLDDVPVAEVVEEVRQIVEPLARQKGLELKIVVIPSPPRAHADRLRLRQVLLNLVENGIKFTEKGHVTLRVSTSDGRRRVLFEVDDTGIGIPLHKRSLVFERFIQAEAGTTRRFGGTGLGLPICRLLVEAMRGSIGIETSPAGAGTRVWFTIPAPGLEGR